MIKAWVLKGVFPFSAAYKGKVPANTLASVGSVMTLSMTWSMGRI